MDVGCVMMLGGTGVALTTSVAGALTTEPAPLLTTTVYTPASPNWRFAMLNNGAVAPAMLAPFFLHWYVSGALPVAATVKVTGSPTRIVCDRGCIVMTGGARLTTTVATSLATTPAGFVAVKT